MTRGNKIRSMTDKQIVDAAFDSGIDDYFEFCQERPECHKVWSVPENGVNSACWNGCRRRTDMGYIISRIIGWALWMALRDLEG